MPLQGAGVRVLCAFWSWVAGAAAGVPLQGAVVRVPFALWSLVAAGCRCKVLLSECRLRFRAWLLVRYRVLLQSAIAGAVAVASFARCCPGRRASFHFPSSLLGPKGPWWVGMPLSLVLAAFLFAHLCYGCGGAVCSISSTGSKSSTSSRKSNAQAAAPAACAAAGAACAASAARAACVAGAASAASAASAAGAASAARAASAASAAAAPAASAASAAAGSDRRRVATLRP